MLGSVASSQIAPRADLSEGAVFVGLTKVELPKKISDFFPEMVGK